LTTNANARGVGFPARGRNLLNNMLFRHLEKAKVNLESEKDHVIIAFT